MKYTILGSSGFIGSHLLASLNKQNVVCYTPSRDHIFSKNENLGHVIYSIGLTSDFRKRSMDTVKAHVSKLIEFLENATFDSFLYLSSTRIYNNANDGCETASFKVNPTDLSDLYNISKIMGESICLSIPNEKIRIARISNVIGNNFNSENFIFSLIITAIDDGKIILNIDPNSSKDYITIDDVIFIIKLIALQGENRIYNISSGFGISNLDLVNEIVKITNCSVEYTNMQKPLNFPTIDNQRIKDEFRYIPKNILPEIKKLVDSYIKQKK